jgi:hypothetical protein
MTLIIKTVKCISTHVKIPLYSFQLPSLTSCLTVKYNPLKRTDHLEVLSADGRITLTQILKETEFEDRDWIHLPQDADQWLALL